MTNSMFFDKDDSVFFKDFGVDFLLKKNNETVRVMFDDEFAEVDPFSLNSVNCRNLKILIKNTDLKNFMIKKDDIFVFDENEFLVNNIEYNNLNISKITLYINEVEDENSY